MRTYEYFYLLYKNECSVYNKNIRSLMEADIMPIEKDIGRTVDIIYMDNEGRFSKRRITVKAVSNGQVRAYDHTKQEARTFRVDGILAREPVSGYAS